jgi:hypothetical protein
MKNIKTKLFASSPELPPTNEQSISSSPVKRRWLGKKFFALVAITAVAIIAIALFAPLGQAVIPLNVDYTVGEKMVYDSTITASYDNAPPATTGPSAIMPKNTTINSQQTIEVTGFDGEYYTLNHTMTMNLNNKPISVSMIEKMNKTGYSAYLLNLGSTQQEIPNNGLTSTSYLAQLLNQPEVKVGDSVNVPFPTGSSSLGITGDLKMTFKGIQDLTVPAGTYKVFRIDITSNDLRMNYQSPLSGLSNFTPANITISMDMNYQIYMEYGTMRQIKASMQESVSTQSATMDYTMNMSMDMALVEHIVPS